jgi:chromosome segregation ATPase
MMAEGSETPNGEPGSGPEGRARRGEGDLFAERRARRAAESGEIALTRRAEAAEATVQTLERHVASLQQRLRETEDERLRVDELLEAERGAALERENELRRVKQREYAEQQLRVEAEEGLTHAVDVGARIERESRVEIERLSARLSASEDEARALARRLEAVQLQLAEVEREAGAERTSARRAEQDLQARLSDLERRALEIQRGLDGERAARERSERMLEGMRDGNRRMEQLLGETKGVVGRLTMALATRGQAGIARHTTTAGPAQPRGAEMADALAEAVGRLRARAAAAPVGELSAAPAIAPAGEEVIEDAPPAAPGAVPSLAPEPAPAEAEAPIAPAPQRPAHKHSLSWFARRRIRRKQRRERRGK